MDIPLPLPLLLDGGTGTNLLSYGFTFDQCLPQWALEHPAQVKALQQAYVQAGCDAVYAPTFGGSRAALSAFGLEDRARELNRDLVAMTKENAPEVLCGASISPTGLSLHPFGDAAISEMKSVFSEQAAAAKEGGADFFAIETMTSLSEARTAVLACRELDLPIFVTMAVDEEGKTPSGASALGCLIVLQELGISAFGLNCGDGPDTYPAIIEELHSFAKVPLIAKPSAGLPHDPDFTYDRTPRQFAEDFKPILQAGAQIAGGCCGTGPEHLAALRETLDRFDFSHVSREKDYHDLVLTNGLQTFSINAESVDFTEPLPCTVDMADQLLALEEDSKDVILLEIHSPDDALQFARNAHIAQLPVCFSADDELSLKTALYLYQGRALVDSQSQLDKDVLHQIAAKYGAIVF